MSAIRPYVLCIRRRGYLKLCPIRVLLLTWNFADKIRAQQAKLRRRGAFHNPHLGAAGRMIVDDRVVPPSIEGGF